MGLKLDDLDVCLKENEIKKTSAAENRVPFENLVLPEFKAGVEGSGCCHTPKESQDFAPTFWHVLTKVFKRNIDPK